MVFYLLGLRLKDAKEEIRIDDNPMLVSSSIVNLLPTSVDTSTRHEDDQPCEAYDCVEVDVYEGDKHDCGEYDMYTKIETHMSISASLYILNRQGVDILKELDAKKLLRKDQKVATTDVGKVYMELVPCINTNRIVTDLYTNLISHLDDVLFDECGELETFYVKEEEYTLESLYYKQGSWVDEIEWQEPQVFTFHASHDMDEGECVYLLMYLNKYTTLLSKIEREYEHSKLHACLDKMRERMTIAHKILADALEAFMQNDTKVV